jgi:hypothetical protein
MDWMVIPQILVVVMVLAFFALGGLNVRGDGVANGYVSDVHNDKQMMISGWTECEIREIVAEFTKEDGDVNLPAFDIELQEVGPRKFRLTFPKDIHPSRFPELINYVAYPTEMNLVGRSIHVGGKATITEGFKGINRTRWGEKAILYIPADDRTNDEVYLQLKGGASFVYSLRSCVWKKVKHARLSAETRTLLSGA